MYLQDTFGVSILKAIIIQQHNLKKIKDFIFKLKNEKGSDTIIVSGGCPTGADRYAKKYALELGFQ